MKLKPIDEWSEAEKYHMLQTLFSVLGGMADDETNHSDADPMQDYDALKSTAKDLEILVPEENDQNFNEDID